MVRELIKLLSRPLLRVFFVGIVGLLALPVCAGITALHAQTELETPDATEPAVRIF